MRPTHTAKMKKILFLLAFLPSLAVAFQSTFNPFTGVPDFVGTSSGTSGSSTTITATAVPFGSAANAVATDTATFTFDNTNKIFKTRTGNFSSTNMNLQLIPGVGTGVIGSLWFQDSSGGGAQLEMDYSALNDGTTTFDLLWGKTNGSGNVIGWNFQDSTKTTIFSIGRTGVLNNSAFNTTTSSVSVTGASGFAVQSSSAGQVSLLLAADSTIAANSNSVTLAASSSSGTLVYTEGVAQSTFAVAGTSVTHTAGDVVTFCSNAPGKLCDGGLVTPTLQSTQYFTPYYSQPSSNTLAGAQDFTNNGSTLTMTAVAQITITNISTATLANSLIDVSLSTVSLGIGYLGGVAGTNGQVATSQGAGKPMAWSTLTGSSLASTQTFTGANTFTSPSGIVDTFGLSVGTITATAGVAFTQTYKAAVCQSGVASLGFSVFSTSAPTANCVISTSTVMGIASFVDTSSASVQDHFTLPSDWVGAVNANIVWTSTTTANSVVWQLRTGCAAAGSLSAVTWNSFSTVTDAAISPANTLNTASINGVSTSGCSAGNEMYFEFFRDPTNGSDTLTATANLVSLQVIIRRTLGL